MKGKRTDFADARCPVARAAGLIGDPWSLLIVRDALRGARRFGELQKSLGLARNILADRLRKLVAGGVLAVQPATEGGSRNEYVLTDKGRRLSVVVTALAQWGGRHEFQPGEVRPMVVDRRDGRPVRLVALAEDGRQLGPGETTLAVAPFDVSSPPRSAELP